MDIAAFSARLRREGLPLFAFDQALLIAGGRPSALRLQLHRWNRKRWLRRLRRGLYELSYPEDAVIPDLYVANRLYDPSYVSLETALSIYAVVPETAPGVTSVTPLPTRRFRNAHGLFTYFTVRPEAYTGCRVESVQGRPVRIAEPEKAVVDLLYARLRRGDPPHFDDERWDVRSIRKMSAAKLRGYADLFGSKRLRIRGLLDALLR